MAFSCWASWSSKNHEDKVFLFTAHLGDLGGGVAAAQPEILFDVGPGCFLPAPKVTSAVIALKIRKERSWNIESPELFFRTVRASFAMRRKKLQNGLASGFPQLGKAGAAQVIASCGLPENVRGETLSIEAFAALSNAIGKALQEG